MPVLAREAARQRAGRCAVEGVLQHAPGERPVHVADEERHRGRDGEPADVAERRDEVARRRPDDLDDSPAPGAHRVADEERTVGCDEHVSRVRDRAGGHDLGAGRGHGVRARERIGNRIDGIAGRRIQGINEVRDRRKNAPFAAISAIEAAMTLVASEPERRHRLSELSQTLRSCLAGRGLPVAPGTSQIVPIVLGDNERAIAVADALQTIGFDVRAIRPPSVPPGTSRLRVAVNVGLTEATLERFAEALAEAVRKTSRCSAVFS